MRCKCIKKINIKMLKNKKLIILIGVLLLVITCCTTFGRYIYDGIQTFYFQTKKFYFNSDKLKEQTATYSLENWAGAGEYTININMNSIKNNLLSSDTDITYDIIYQCSDTVTCQITKTQGTIYSSTNTDSFNIVVTPNTSFNDGDTVLIYVSATSTYPYEKTISARFILKVGKIGLSYEITDEEKSPYLEFRITNTIDYYTVEEAFDSYQVGDRLDITTYLNLPDSKKEKCYSAYITLTFDPNIVRLDLTNPSYLIKENETNTIIDGNSYISGYTYKIDAISSSMVRFYKVNPANNYTYPIVNETSIINFESR
ncbi:MAG: hypothetical protein PUC23_03175 [bacterium]|nr:hypothetical protein [bacterium]